MKVGRVRVERQVKFSCVRKGNGHIKGNKSHETTIFRLKLKLNEPEINQYNFLYRLKLERYFAESFEQPTYAQFLQKFSQMSG